MTQDPPGRPLIVFLPGIGGSALADPRTGEAVWDMGKRDIASLGLRPSRLSLAESPRLTPTGLVRSAKFLWFTMVPGYEPLLAALQQFGTVDEQGDPKHPVPGVDVVVVPYDFRRSIACAAERLDDVINAHLNSVSENDRAGRIILIGHSMGGLVARHWLGPMQRWRWCRALLTLGTPHRGAPKALDWLVNGARIPHTPGSAWALGNTTAMLRGWPSVSELLPRYQAIQHTSTGQPLYPHDLHSQVGGLAGARNAYALHEAIERSWYDDVPRGGPEVTAYLGWSHKTLESAHWNGTGLRVIKKRAQWLDTRGWEKDLGDGTVPAISAVPIEMSGHVQGVVRLRDRHIPITATPRAIQAVLDYLRRVSICAVRGDETGHQPALGLDLDDTHHTSRPIPVSVEIREVTADLSTTPVWVAARRIGDHTTAAIDLRLEHHGGTFVGELPALAEGLWHIKVTAQEVPGGGQMEVADTIAVLDDADLATDGHVTSVTETPEPPNIDAPDGFGS